MQKQFNQSSFNHSKCEHKKKKINKIVEEKSKILEYLNYIMSEEKLIKCILLAFTDLFHRKFIQNRFLKMIFKRNVKTFSCLTIWLVDISYNIGPANGVNLGAGLPAAMEDVAVFKISLFYSVLMPRKSHFTLNAQFRNCSKITQTPEGVFTW